MRSSPVEADRTYSSHHRSASVCIGYQGTRAGADTLAAVPVLLILLLFCALTLILLVPAIKGMKSRPLVVPSDKGLPEE